jgi:hypothetical protein
VEASFIIRSRMGNDTWPRSANSHRSKGHVNMPPTFPVVFVCVNMPPNSLRSDCQSDALRGASQKMA